VIFEPERWLLLSWLKLLFNYEMRENRESLAFIFKQKTGPFFAPFAYFVVRSYPSIIAFGVITSAFSKLYWGGKGAPTTDLPFTRRNGPGAGAAGWQGDWERILQAPGGC
jgi:hypothetical protein